MENIDHQKKFRPHESMYNPYNKEIEDLYNMCKAGKLSKEEFGNKLNNIQKQKVKWAKENLSAWTVEKAYLNPVEELLKVLADYNIPLYILKHSGMSKIEYNGKTFYYSTTNGRWRKKGSSKWYWSKTAKEFVEKFVVGDNKVINEKNR